jgi:uncharacterized protein (DUF433 family)
MFTEVVDLSKYIAFEPDTGRPRIKGRRVPVATIAYSTRSEGWNNAELAYQFTLSEAEVLAALLYYAEHQAEIDAQESAYQAQLDAAYHEHNTGQYAAGFEIKEL